MCLLSHWDYRCVQKYEPRFGGGPGGPPEEQRNRRDLTIEDALALKRLSGLVAAVSQERYLFGGNIQVRAGREEANGPLILGTNPDYSEANTHFVDDGRFITDADLSHSARVAVIGTDVAQALFPHRDAVDEVITVNGVPHRVIGIFEHKGGMFGSNNNFVAVPITTFDEQFPEVKNGHGDTIHIATVPRRAEDVQALIEEETAILRARRGLRPNRPTTSRSTRARPSSSSSATRSAWPRPAIIAGIRCWGRGPWSGKSARQRHPRTREIGVRRHRGPRRTSPPVLWSGDPHGVGGALASGGLGAAAGPVVFDSCPAPLWAVLLGFASQRRGRHLRPVAAVKASRRTRSRPAVRVGVSSG